MINKKLLKENVSFDIKWDINESTDLKNKNIMILKGIIQKANVKNANGRVYPLNILKQAVNEYIKARVENRSAFGELDHPDRSDISLGNVCHIINKIWWEGDNVLAEIEILDTPAGNILRKLIERKITIGISSRALGSVKYNHSTGDDEVEEDLEIVCWDFVSTPSTPGAYPKLVTENTDNNKSLNIDKLNSIFSNIFQDLEDWK